MPQYIKDREIFNIDISKTLGNVKILRLLETASRYIGEVNNIVSNTLEFDFIIVALKNIEALNSAKIEGTTGNLKDLYLEKSLDFEKKKQLKLFSAVNYKTVMTRLEEIMQAHNRIDIPLLHKLHKLLTENDPATNGVPGKFRTKEVIIRNSKLGDFWPIHPLKINECMKVFVDQISEKTEFPSLLQAAILHYQFEAIHPFEDGNGRTGRLLIIANLLTNKTIKTAILNLSQHFGLHRDEYLSSLRSVSDSLDYETWISFFLNALIEQCKHNINLIEDLRKLKEEDELLINESTRSPAAQPILNHALNQLYITTSDTVEFLKNKRLKGDLSQIARNNIKRLVQLGILEKTLVKRGRAETYVH